MVRGFNLRLGGDEVPKPEEPAQTNADSLRETNASRKAVGNLR